MKIKNRITNAFRYLMVEKGFDHIVVEDILKEAGVARSTFYRRFHDKYDVMNYYFVRELAENSSPYEKSLEFYARSVAEYYYIVAKDPLYYQEAFKTVGQNSFSHFIFDNFYQWLIKMKQAASGSDYVSTEDLYAFSFASAGCLEMISRWVKEEMRIPMIDITQWELRNAPGAVLEMFQDSDMASRQYITKEKIQKILNDVQLEVSERPDYLKSK
ncbi:TetR family transcriptional regulator [Aerococcus mictus]|uniref:TetR family transcriptional regulator n=1 Tax=Aerococcus mictus TaxID=2976810 RepID=UPI000DCC5221|nr:TetR family transcriptional regulator [Aerococcus mictus]WMF95513.1 TetR family transcriptional regulator [Aerococcus mictus]